MPLSLERIPGFADVPDVIFAHDNIASGLNVSRIAQNAMFGMVRMEVYSGFYKHGQTVPVPISGIDGYQYSRSELLYIWAVQDTRNPSTGWITGPDSLWYGAWIVDQTTGGVECLEFYRRSGDHDNAAQSNDGTLQVWTIAQRQLDTLIMATEADAYTDIDDSEFAVDKPFTEAIAQGLNRNSKFGAVNSEVIYMGEYVGGDTIPQPESPVDGHVYAYADCAFQHSWRWTTTNSVFNPPAHSLGQLGPIKASIDGATGAVTISVEYINDSNTTLSTHGRIAVFAFCSRSSLIDTIPGTANDFAETDLDLFRPGETLRASHLLQLNKNAREAACSPEFFGPTEYVHGDTVPTPTSALDGYAYSRDEMHTIWEWSDTSPQTGDNLRTAGFYGKIGPTGIVFLVTWRLPPGGDYDPTNDYAKIMVTVVAMRGSQHAAITAPGSTSAPSGSNVIVDDTGTQKSPYAIAYWGGDSGTAPAGDEVLLRHAIPNNEIAGVDFSVNFSGAVGGCLDAPSDGDYVITVKDTAASTIGTMTIANGATTMTFSVASGQHADPGDWFDFVGPSSADSTINGIFFSIPGKRT